MLGKDLADLGCEPDHGAAEERVRGGKRRGIRDAFRVDWGAEKLGELDQLGMSAALRHRVPGHDERAFGRGQERGRPLERRSVGADPERDAARPAELDFFLCIQNVGRQRKKYRSRRRRAPS